MKLKLGGLVLVLLLSYWTIRPLFQSGLFPIHDDTQTGRVIEMQKAFDDGHFPVRWSKNLGYGFGYPLFNFYAPLPYYFGGIFLHLFNNPIFATKLMYVFGIITSGIFMYLFVYEFLGFIPALVSAVLYMYAPYHAVQIYVRGAVGEYWAYGLLPAVLWGIYQIIKKESTLSIIVSSFLIALLILSHNIISMLFFIMITMITGSMLIFNLVSRKNSAKLRNIIISLICGLLLSSFFWLPAIFETKYTNISSIVQGGSFYYDHFLYPDQLWNSPWGWGGSAPSRADGMSFKLGKIQILIGLFGLFSLYLFKFKKKIDYRGFIVANLMLLSLIISLFMVLPQSSSIWNFGAPILKFIQFPWRFLVFIILAAAFFSGFVFLFFRKTVVRYIIGVLLIFITIFVNVKYFTPQYFLNLTNSDYRKEDYLKWTVSKISDEYLPDNFIKPIDTNNLSKNLILYPGNLQYDMIEDRTANIHFRIDNNYQGEIILNKTYFPGWIGFLNGRKIELNNSNGLISFPLYNNSHDIVLFLTETPVRLLGNTLSVFTLLGILIILIRKNLIIRFKIIINNCFRKPR